MVARVKFVRQQRVQDTGRMLASLRGSGNSTAADISATPPPPETTPRPSRSSPEAEASLGRASASEPRASFAISGDAGRGSSSNEARAESLGELRRASGEPGRQRRDGDDVLVQRCESEEVPSTYIYPNIIHHLPKILMKILQLHFRCPDVLMFRGSEEQTKLSANFQHQPAGSEQS